MKRMITTAKAIELQNHFRELHGRVKAVKSQGQDAIIVVPFVLSGKARYVLNDNLAALLAVTKPYEDALKVLQEQSNEKLDAMEKIIETENPGEEERSAASAAYGRILLMDVQKQAVEMEKREKEVDLEPLTRVDLNEQTNAFEPNAFATLLNEGYIVTPNKSKAKAGGEVSMLPDADADVTGE